MISTIGQILLVLLTIYGLLLFIRIMLSWISLPPSKFTYYLNKATDPVFDFAKRYFPIKIGIFDLSIVVPFILISLLSCIISDFMILGRPLSIFYLPYLIFIIISIIENFVFWIILISSGVILLLHIFNIYNYNPVVSSLHALIDPVVHFLNKFINLRYKNSEAIYLAIIIILTLIAHFILSAVIGYFIALFLNLNNNFYK
jgi:uncharacterized protein YggT (Ycf19 family)